MTTGGQTGPDEPARSPWPRGFGGWALVALALALVLTASWLLYRFEAARMDSQLAQRETGRVSLLSELLRSQLRPVTSDLRLLADGDGLRGYLDNSRGPGLAAAIRRARMLSISNPDYDQLRFIDAQGQEVLRVDHGGRVVPPADLQNKADRGYFKRANALAADDLYISAFDLNIEHGQVETPFKPMLRFATPVFDAAGHRRGIYVINYLGAGLIDNLLQASGGYGQRLRLLNSGGFWLKAANPTEEWGFMVPERARYALPVSNPDLWSRMQLLQNGQSHERGHLFTWQRLPLADIATAMSGRLQTDEAFLVLASEVSPAEWAEQLLGLRQIMLLVATGLALLVLLSAWLLRGRRRLLARLRAMNHELELRVRERTAELEMSLDLLQHREALLEETGQLAKVGGWEFDPATGDGSWTPEIARIHDLDVSVRPSKELGLQFYPDQSRRRLEAALDKSLADGTPYDLELEFVSARGARKWVRTISRPLMQDGRVVRMRGALQDITERKQSELRLHAQLQRLHLLERTTRAIGERQDLASILQVVIRTLEEQLPLDFGCVFLYEPNERMLTVTAVGVASMALARELALPEQARVPIDANGLSRCVQGQLVYEPDIAAMAFPFPQRLAAGGLRALIAAPLQIESQVFGVLIAARRAPHSFSSGDCEFVRQISEHVALAAHQAQLYQALQGAYDDLRDTQQSVMQQERLRVLGQMASGIAHDINNSIAPIVLYTDSLLERETGLSERARQSLLTIQQAAGDVAETVARMREFYRQRDAQTEMRPVELNPLMVQLRELTRPRWETIPQRQGIVINLVLDLATPLPTIQGIESEIREALTNLVFNAVDAMPAGGTLTLRTLPADADHVCVEVTDSGSGMDEETRRRCLEPFFTTKGERGTGLGLAMVYGVMQRHGGAIAIDSTPGAGTTMRLTFVATEATRAAASEAAAEPPTGLRILLIDDDPILIHSLREILQLDGHRILTAGGGQSGIDTFLASLQPGAERIDIVITDLGMPHVDGRSVAAAVKRASSATPVLLLTGWGERLQAEGQTMPNVDRVLGKPPRLRELRGVLAELVRQRPA